jgi:hypothetical protein
MWTIEADRLNKTDQTTTDTGQIKTDKEIQDGRRQPQMLRYGIKTQIKDKYGLVLGY